MNQLALRRILRRALGASLASLAATSSACGGQTEQGSSGASLGDASVPDGARDGAAPPFGIDVTAWEPIPCGEPTGMDLGALRVGLGVEYLEARSRPPVLDPNGGRQEQVLASSGAKCGGAPDVGACGLALRNATRTYGFNFSMKGDFTYFVATRGADVVAIGNLAELQALARPVQSTAEAWGLAWASGLSWRCEGNRRGWARKTGDRLEVIAFKMTKSCNPIETSSFLLSVSSSGEVAEVRSEVLETLNGGCVGRRPSGLASPPVACATSPVADYLAETARLEAASVDAFRVLAGELRAHGAPEHLVRKARRAASDEVRHARVTRHHARRFGGAPRAPRVERRAVRALEAIAIENAVEGCVRETYGVLVGAWQAKTARDAGLARAMRVIVRDETRHAALSWEIAAWLDAQLDAPARERVRQARDAAVRGLLADLAREPAEALVRVAGVPRAAPARAMAASLAASLWEAHDAAA